MASKTVSFNTNFDQYHSPLDSIAKWLSCNGEPWGMGPTAVFASAATLFLYNELVATVFVAGDQADVSMLEKTLISSMVLGMLALMVHVWVCLMRFFQYYLDTLIKDSPSIFLEMTTAGLLGTQTSDMVPLGTLMRFLRNQQPQIHITMCWFLSLCYADYVRKHYCQRFNMPYLEQWQTELQARVRHSAHRVACRVTSIVHSLQRRLRGDAQPATRTENTECSSPKESEVDLCNAGSKVSCRSEPSETQTKELSVRILSKSSETTADAIEKLRRIISATRCVCRVTSEPCHRNVDTAAEETK